MLLSNHDQYILSETVEKKSGGYGAQISEAGLFVSHTFNVLGEFSMCQTLTGVSTYYVTISAYLFSERYLVGSTYLPPPLSIIMKQEK